MSRLLNFCIALAAVVLTTGPVQAEMIALAHVDPGQSLVEDRGREVAVTIALSQPVPWRAFTLDGPRRLVIDLKAVTWPETIPETSEHAEDLRLGQSGDGWSRLVLGLTGPLSVSQAGLDTSSTDGAATLNVSLSPVSAEAFAASAHATPTAVTPPRPRGQAGDDRIIVALDPGHGGHDPGAEADGLIEADLMLTFARELRETLRRQGEFEGILIRDSDEFVPLEHRITRARQAGADVFLSLHADALPADSGHASGATIYTLSDSASDSASRKLAERHDQSDLLAGIDLTGQGDEVALILMELARNETAPEAEDLAAMLVKEIREDLGRMNTRPLRSAGFSVLKAPDFPSVLIELGFLSSEQDRKNLKDPIWRGIMAQAITDALVAWADTP